MIFFAEPPPEKGSIYDHHPPQFAVDECPLEGGAGYQRPSQTTDDGYNHFALIRVTIVIICM